MRTEQVPDAIKPLLDKIQDDHLYAEREAGAFLGLGQKAMQKRRANRQPPDFVRCGTRSVRYPGRGLKTVLLAGAVTTG